MGFCCCPACCLNVCIYVCNMYIKWRRQAFQTGGRGHFIRWKIVGGGGKRKNKRQKNGTTLLHSEHIYHTGNEVAGRLAIAVL